MPSNYVCNNKLCNNYKNGEPCRVGCIIDGQANYCARCDATKGAFGEVVEITVIYCQGGRR